MDELAELELIRLEYEGYFCQCEVVQRSSKPHIANIKAGIPLPHHLVIVGADLLTKIGVCENGWFQLGQSQYFQTFESLMQTFSPEFRARFAGDLAAKLNNLERRS